MLGPDVTDRLSMTEKKKRVLATFLKHKCPNIPSFSGGYEDLLHNQ